MKTLAYGKTGGCILLVCGKQPLLAEEWYDYMRFLEGQLIPGTRPIGLVYTDGAGPTAAQRQQMNELIARVVGELKAAVLVSSHLARAIVTALNWTNPVHRTFAPKELDAAIAWLGVAEGEVPKVKYALEALKREILRP